MSLTNNRPDQLVATFGGAPATLADPNVGGMVTFAPSVGGGNNYTELLTFSTAGTYTGTINLNLLASNPDYAFDGGTATVEAPSFTYRIDVLATAVPEPATWVAMVAGFGLMGASFRRRRSFSAPDDRTQRDSPPATAVAQIIAIPPLTWIVCPVT